MAEYELVERLRKGANSRSGVADVMSDGSIVWHPIMNEAADAIETLAVALEPIAAEFYNTHMVIPALASGETKITITVNASVIQNAYSALAKLKGETK